MYFVSTKDLKYNVIYTETTKIDIILVALLLGIFNNVNKYYN